MLNRKTNQMGMLNMKIDNMELLTRKTGYVGMIKKKTDHMSMWN